MDRSLVAVLLFLPTLSSAADMRTLKNETIQGDVAQITDKEIVINKAGAKIATPIPQVLTLDLHPVAKRGSENCYDIELTDGSLLHCSKLEIIAAQLRLTLLSGPMVEIPLTAVSNILAEAQVEKNRKDWTERLADRKAKMRRRDVLAVRRDGVLNALEGTLDTGDDKGETIEFSVGTGKKRAVPLAGVAGLIFERGINPDAAPVVCKVTTVASDAIQASAVASANNQVTLKTPSGATLVLPLDQLARLDFSGGKLTYLADLEPIEVVERFFDGNPFHYQRDRSQDGPIRLDNQTYPRGLSLHAHTELTYDLKGDYREFKAVVGINDAWSGTTAGPTLFRVEGDGKTLKEQLFDRRDKVRHATITLNIKDVQKLRITVADGDTGLRLGLGKQLDLGDAKVSK